MSENKSTVFVNLVKKAVGLPTGDSSCCGPVVATAATTPTESSCCGATAATTATESSCCGTTAATTATESSCCGATTAPAKPQNSGSCCG